MSHHDVTVEQFTRQADGFAHAHASGSIGEEPLRVLLDVVAPRSDDVALDVACGPGSRSPRSLLAWSGSSGSI